MGRTMRRPRKSTKAPGTDGGAPAAGLPSTRQNSAEAAATFSPMACGPASRRLRAALQLTRPQNNHSVLRNQTRHQYPMAPWLGSR